MYNYHICRYDIILDCAKMGPEYVRMKGYPHDTYIALNSPLLNNFDHHGLIMGMVKNLGDLLKFNIPKAENKSCVKWGFFIPSQTGINVLQKLVENEEVCSEIPEFYCTKNSLICIFYSVVRRSYLSFNRYILFKICHRHTRE